MIRFWNGNKSKIRQVFEWRLFQLVVSNTDPDSGLYNDLTNYPKAKDEAEIFTKGFDALVTVAGNKKFEQQPYLMLPKPLCRGLLGCRVLIIHKDRLDEFSVINEHKLKQLTLGVPATWADAELFRFNKYEVDEKGDLQERLVSVQNGDCDYLALGLNEAKAILNEYAEVAPDLIVESSLLLYYPFPLVFYVRPERQDLLNKISEGLAQCIDNGKLDDLFEQTYGKSLRAAKLHQRRVFNLVNPILPTEIADYQSELLLSPSLTHRNYNRRD